MVSAGLLLLPWHGSWQRRGNPPKLPKKLDLIGYLQAGYAGVKADLTSAAEAMPEVDYGFKPTSMPEVRTFGETILHVASAHFSMCARLRGVADEPRQKIKHTNKSDVLKTLAASFTFCDAALSSREGQAVRVPLCPVERDRPCVGRPVRPEIVCGVERPAAIADSLEDYPEQCT